MDINVLNVSDMSKYIQVAEDESEESMEVPLEEDRTLLLSTLNAQFPGSCGLKYRNPDSGAMRGIRLSDGRLYPPDGEWSNRIYLAVFPKGLSVQKLLNSQVCTGQISASLLTTVDVLVRL